MSDLDPIVGLAAYLIFLYSTVGHEAGHAWAAYKLGDDTAYRGGQVSLDPLPHIKREPLGMVVVPILSWFVMGGMFGWASAPYNRDWALRNPRRAAVMSLAGPAVNLILLLAAALLIRVGLEWKVFDFPSTFAMSSVVQAVGGRFWEFGALVLSITFTLNLLLFCFNLLPLPPLDGASLPLLFLSESASEKYQEVMAHPSVAFFGLFVAWQAFGNIFAPVLLFALRLLYAGAG